MKETVGLVEEGTVEEGTVAAALLATPVAGTAVVGVVAAEVIAHRCKGAVLHITASDVDGQGEDM